MTCPGCGLRPPAGGPSGDRAWGGSPRVAGRLPSHRAGMSVSLISASEGAGSPRRPPCAGTEAAGARTGPPCVARHVAPAPGTRTGAAETEPALGGHEGRATCSSCDGGDNRHTERDASAGPAQAVLGWSHRAQCKGQSLVTSGDVTATDSSSRAAELPTKNGEA